MTNQKRHVEPDHVRYEAALQAAIELLSRFPEELTPDRDFAEKLDYQAFSNSIANDDLFLPQFVRRFGATPEFQQAVLAASAEALATGGALPAAVREYAAQFVKGGAKVQGRPGKHPRENKGRDTQICLAVDKVAQEFDYPHSRNTATMHKGGPEAACSIVSRALEACGLHLSEAGVAKIWKDSLIRIR